MASSQPKYIPQLPVNKRILILGATSGIGFAVAEAPLEHGTIVTISGSNPTKLYHALTRLQTQFPSATKDGRLAGPLPCDLFDATHVEKGECCFTGGGGYGGG
ncbi:hypothetical protein BDW59DRAFT_166067 [Aspergillus cavernicola]|uniref:Uncharacterized protein n=1 Tax=Aspergillus cavernicola TaxID=176166 RepID=A0ABR4HP48_9EURO